LIDAALAELLAKRTRVLNPPSQGKWAMMYVLLVAAAGESLEAGVT
jgi:hypothetical protein